MDCEVTSEMYEIIDKGIEPVYQVIASWRNNPRMMEDTDTRLKMSRLLCDLMRHADDHLKNNRSDLCAEFSSHFIQIIKDIEGIDPDFPVLTMVRHKNRMLEPL